MKNLLKLRENINIYLVNKEEQENLINMNIKSSTENREVRVNHYTIEGEYLKKVHYGTYDVLIREEIDQFNNTLMANAYITEDFFKKGKFSKVSSYLSKKALKIAY